MKYIQIMPVKKCMSFISNTQSAAFTAFINRVYLNFEHYRKKKWLFFKLALFRFISYNFVRIICTQWHNLRSVWQLENRFQAVVSSQKGMVCYVPIKLAGETAAAEPRQSGKQKKKEADW